MLLILSRPVIIREGLLSVSIIRQSRLAGQVEPVFREFDGYLRGIYVSFGLISDTDIFIIFYYKGRMKLICLIFIFIKKLAAPPL